MLRSVCLAAVCVTASGFASFPAAFTASGRASSKPQSSSKPGRRLPSICSAQETAGFFGGHGPVGGGGGAGRGWFGGGWGGGGGSGGSGGEGFGRAEGLLDLGLSSTTYLTAEAKAEAGKAIASPKTKMVMEEETKIRYPLHIFTDETEELSLSLVSAGARKARAAWRPWKQETEYAVGLYVSEAEAKGALQKELQTRKAKGAAKASSEELVRAALESRHTTKAVRIVMAKEMDSFDFVKAINDQIEAKMAKRSYVDLAWLELWRNWMSSQGGYKQRLPRGIEVRLMWDREGGETTGKGAFITQV